MITLIKNGLVITMDEERKEKYEKLDIVIKDDKIINIESSYEGAYDRIIDANNKIVMPGLINCHTHLGMSLFRATNDNLILQDWLEKKIWPVEDKMTEEDIYLATLLSCIEMIKTGTTCANDMYFGWKGAVKAIEKTKVRMVMSRCIIGKDEESVKEKENDFETLIKENKQNPLMTFTVAPHSMYTCSKETLNKCKTLSEKYNLPIHIHFCENKQEVEDIKNEYKKTPVRALEEIGYLNKKLILAHGTFIEKQDQKLLKDKDISIVTNPISNLNLGCGIADLTSYKQNGINISIGTDGQGSGNSLNLFKQMSLVANLQKAIYQDPTVMSSYEVLKMATINGAKALDLETQIGSITKGKKADIIILDLNQTQTFPYPDLLTQIVNNIETNNIETTIINGEIVYLNHKLSLELDEKKLKEDVMKLCKKLKI